ncbi:hypothetical protein, partial [Klebsiella pneumoniae]|uniref:hypothetical protein n=1 Tax=Klebsiella pneumoniae TaxID=573 RepID=UPI001D0F0584
IYRLNVSFSNTLSISLLITEKIYELDIIIEELEEFCRGSAVYIFKKANPSIKLTTNSRNVFSVEKKWQSTVRDSWEKTKELDQLLLIVAGID